MQLKTLGCFCNCQKLPKVSNRPKGKNSPNRVALQACHHSELNSSPDKISGELRGPIDSSSNKLLYPRILAVVSYNATSSLVCFENTKENFLLH
jgi:hypothetical protein